MKTITVKGFQEIKSSTSSRGNQGKWQLDSGVWVKSDSLGYEGLVEYISSVIIENSNLNELYEYVKYIPCKIYLEDTDTEYLGCYSDNFLVQGEEFITLERLFEKYRGKSLYLLTERMSTQARIMYTVTEVDKITKIEGFGEWLTALLEFDYLILNEDRHFHNIGVIKGISGWRVMPIFDNGAGLFADKSIYYKEGEPLTKFYRKIKSKPFSTDFKKQVVGAQELFGSQFIPNENCLQRCLEALRLNNPYPQHIIERVSEVLMRQFYYRKEG